ncbi:MAG TPA: hypothetical protein VFO10_09175 [Oligoflexus sp.]|uniref:hypothetical protein n=1 Tax=Oligoflexus sp. TaxID=1971216 RepID=UPI002D7EA693|nr:hypothetical protein [Oligoflexus sp.]HET9237410.1 hypothetical protein [Oligoflexus sp.]
MFHSVAISRRFLMSVLLAVAPLSGCNFKEEKDDGAETVTVDPATPVSFAEIQSKVLEPYCISCHSSGGGNQGGVNLDGYAAAKAEAAEIQRSTVDSKRMPKGGAMSADLRALLGAWIAQGTPE